MCHLIKGTPCHPRVTHFCHMGRPICHMNILCEHSVQWHLDTQSNELQVKISTVKWESIHEFKVELSDDTGFDDAGWCQEFGSDVVDHITQDDVRINLKSAKCGF